LQTTPPEPSRPLGVAILAVLIGIAGILWTLLGLLVIASVSIGAYTGAIPSVFGVTGIVAGIVLLIVGLIVLGLALGLWHQRMWALVLTILFLLVELAIYGYARDFLSWGFVIALVLLVYLAAVHRHFD
jgi:hypothetical protein